MAGYSTGAVSRLHFAVRMVTRAAASLLILVSIAVALTLASAQASPPAPAPDHPGTTATPPEGGDEAAQRTIFGPTHRVTLVLGAVLVVLALGLFVAGVRRGPRTGERTRRRGHEPVTRGKTDRAA
jgi:hypothetical protein